MDLDMVADRLKPRVREFALSEVEKIIRNPHNSSIADNYRENAEKIVDLMLTEAKCWEMARGLLQEMIDHLFHTSHNIGSYEALVEAAVAQLLWDYRFIECSLNNGGRRIFDEVYQDAPKELTMRKWGGRQPPFIPKYPTSR